MNIYETKALDGLEDLFSWVRNAITIPEGTILILCLNDDYKTFWAGGQAVEVFPGVGSPIPAKNPRFRLLDRDQLEIIRRRGFGLYVAIVRPVSD